MRTQIMALLLVFATQSSAENLPSPNATFPTLNMDEVRLGQLLFYDPILSGNKTVSCATCHHPRFGTSDGLALGIGDGGIGLGPSRQIDANNPPEQRIPRNAPALFNLGTAEFSVLFHDGRLEADPNDPTGFRTPLGADMEAGFDSVLSAQTMFPVLSPDEMAGHYSENEIAQAVRQGFFTGPNGAWNLLSKRVADIPEYNRAFARLNGSETPIHFSDISNAIAAFMAFEWRADNSPFDQHLRSQKLLNTAQTKGMDLFYGAAGCSDCHSGQFQTDHRFHAVGMVQIGPGKAARFESHSRDTGRMRVTGAKKDAFAFRTPSLRNVTHTAPYGHSGAFATLRSMLEHHADPVPSWDQFDPNQLLLPPLTDANDFSILQNEAEVAAIQSEISPNLKPLTQQNISDIIAFLGSLTDDTAIQGRLGIPNTVPSGLPIDR